VKIVVVSELPPPPLRRASPKKSSTSQARISASAFRILLRLAANAPWHANIPMTGTRYHERIAACRRADLAQFVPWCVGDAVVGCVHRDRVPLLRDHAAFERDPDRLQLRGADFTERSIAIARVVDALHRRGEVRVPTLEMYPVTAGAGQPPLLQIDRTAVPWFGVRASGVHVNGHVPSPDGGRTWVAERSRGKRTFPGHLDNMVAGGQSIGMSPNDTVTKECAEEAAIPGHLAERAALVGWIDYAQQDGLSLKVDSLACFDLELPLDFQPAPSDGEVERFVSFSLPELAASLRSDDLWKPNSALVALHFLLRRGALDAELAADRRWRLWQHLHGQLP